MQFGFHTLRRLAKLDKSDVEEVVLYALGAAVADGVVIRALRDAAASAPHLDSVHRIHLDHMLEHAAEGSYVKASGSLYPGLEGAFGEIARRKAIIARERTWVSNPNKKVKFETVVKRLGLEHEFELFVVRAVLGEAGDPYRHGHGDATRGVRHQVLFGIAAHAG